MNRLIPSNHCIVSGTFFLGYAIMNRIDRADVERLRKDSNGAILRVFQREHPYHPNLSTFQTAYANEAEEAYIQRRISQLTGEYMKVQVVYE